MRVLTFSTHPIQYQYPLFMSLASRDVIDLEICYYTGYDGSAGKDPGFGRSVVWDIPVRPGNFRQFRAWGERGCPEPTRTFSPGSVFYALRSRPDVVLLHSGLHAGDLAVLAACRARGIPVVCRPETLSYRRHGSSMFKARSWVLRSADALCAIGSRARQRLMEAGVPETRIVMSPYSIDVERFGVTRELTRREARAFIGIPDDLPVVLFAGKLTERKRPLDVVKALSLASFPARLVIAGTGQLSTRVWAEVERHHIPCTDLGFVNQSRIPYVYRAANVVVLPSDWEPWGLAVNEAMACGTPAVCSTGVASGDDLVQPIDPRLVHPVGDPQSLAVALTHAISDETGELERRVVDRIDHWTQREAVDGLVRAFDLAGAARPSAKP
jgi:glycosyltransferase involved in cell wall biosynthesis